AHTVLAIRRAERRSEGIARPTIENFAELSAQALQPCRRLVWLAARVVSGAADGPIREIRAGRMGARGEPLPPEVGKPGAGHDSNDHRSTHRARAVAQPEGDSRRHGAARPADADSFRRAL